MCVHLFSRQDLSVCNYPPSPSGTEKDKVDGSTICLNAPFSTLIDHRPLRQSV